MELQKLMEGRNNGFIYRPVEVDLRYLPSDEEIKRKYGKGVFIIFGRDKHGRIIVIKKMVIR